MPERASIACLFDEFELVELARLCPPSVDDLCARVIDAVLPPLPIEKPYGVTGWSDISLTPSAGLLLPSAELAAFHKELLEQAKKKFHDDTVKYFGFFPPKPPTFDGE